MGSNDPPSSKDPPQVHLLLPVGWDDPRRPSGGNHYDQRLCGGLRAAGWDVRVSTAPAVPPADRDQAIGQALAVIPDGARVLIDGLIASPAATALAPHTPRLRVTVLLHMPLVTAWNRSGDTGALASEAAVLAGSVGVVVTSRWARQQVLARYPLAAERIHVAWPGVDRVAVALEGPGNPIARTGSGATDNGAVRSDRGVGERLLCVGVLAPHKGQDVLVDALIMLAAAPAPSDPEWSCVLVGGHDADPGFAANLRHRVARAGLSRRIRFAGVLDRAELGRAYRSADVLITPSRAETYGMVVTEALASGLPVFASDVGGLPEALRCLPDGSRPGRLLPPGDPAALAAALRHWWRRNDDRAALYARARRSHEYLPTWEQAVLTVAAALDEQHPHPSPRR